MVFQSYALYPHMSVRENLAFGLKLRKVPKAEIERRVNEAAETIQLQKLLDRKPKELSGGQRQRVALGRAIVREPAVFLMDEPLSNLDAKLRVQTRAEIARLHQRLKTTVVYVTHDQVEAMTMGTRIAVMNEGLLQQVGTPQTLYDTPINRFVAGFIGSPSMNFVDVTVDGTGDTARLVGPGRLVDPDPAALPRRSARTGRQDARRRASGRSTSTSARPARTSARSGLGPTSSSTSATRSSSTSTPPTRTSSRSSARSIGSGRATSSTSSCRSSKLHLFDGETGADPRARTRRRPPDRSTGPTAATATQRPRRRSRPGADLVERVVDSRVLHRGALPDLPGRHDRAGRRHARRAATSSGTPARSPSSRSTPRTGSCSSASGGVAVGEALLEIPAGTLDVADDGVDRGPGARRARASSRRRPACGPGRGASSRAFFTAPGFATS